MDTFLERFPQLTKLIFSELSNESLVKSMEVDTTWKKCINGQKLPWIRMIENKIGTLNQYPETWKKVTSKTPVTNVQELALAVNGFYNCDKPGWTSFTPMHIIAGKVIREKSRGEGSLIVQDTIENVSEPNFFF